LKHWYKHLFFVLGDLPFQGEMTVIEVKLVSMSSHINLSGQYLPPAHLNGKYHRPLKQTIILDEPGAKRNDDVMVGGSITKVLGILMW
jgi:hypothetical protein